MDALPTLHWLRLPQRVDFKVAVMTFRVLHGLAPPSYLNDLVRVADLSGRRRLRSSSSHQPLVPPFRLTTVARHTFPVAASLLCNSLPSDIQSISSLHVLHRRLKIFLLWPPYIADADIIFCSCGFFFLPSFFPPILSRRRLDVYHTSKHGVALVRI